jgi:hypothetical protein
MSTNGGTGGSLVGSGVGGNTGEAGDSGSPSNSGGSGGSTGQAGDAGLSGDSASGGAAGTGSTTTGGRPGGGAGGVIAAGGTSGTTIGDASVDSPLTPGLIAYYPCEAVAQGLTLPDMSGNDKNATLGSGSSTVGAFSFAAGKVGNALDLKTSAQGFALLPQDLLANAHEATIATWVYVNHSVTNQRVFDFGKDKDVYMYLTARDGITSAVAFMITVNGYAAPNEQTVSGQQELAVGTWSHVAVVLGATGAIIYVNGQQVGASAAVTLRPADLGSLPSYYIGRSQYPNDPYFDGNVDEFRVYNRALSASQIQALYGS